MPTLGRRCEDCIVIEDFVHFSLFIETKLGYTFCSSITQVNAVGAILSLVVEDSRFDLYSIEKNASFIEV